MKLAFYLRLSLADGDLGKNNKDESNSIENQRLILQNFVESMDELDGDVTEYVDDGHTGTNFNRPAFQAMVEDAKRGKIEVILAKKLEEEQKNKQTDLPAIQKEMEKQLETLREERIRQYEAYAEGILHSFSTVRIVMF